VGLAIVLLGTQAAVCLVGGLALLGFAGVLTAMPAFRPRGGEAATLKGVLRGARCIGALPLLWIVTAIAAVAVAAFSALESAVPPAVAQTSPTGAEGLTAYLAGAGLGALLGATALAALGKTPRLSWFFKLALVGMAGGVALPTVWTSLEGMAIAGLIVGVSYGGLGPALNTAFLILPPTHLRAPVGGVSTALSMALAPNGAVAAGDGFTVFDKTISVWIVAGVLATLALVSFATPNLPRKPERTAPKTWDAISPRGLQQRFP
jgi:hypothetical protein